MSERRMTLAEALDEADNRWQHGIGASGYDPNGPPEWLADAALAWLRDRLADEALRDRAARRLRDRFNRRLPLEGFRLAVDDAYDDLAEHLGAS